MCNRHSTINPATLKNHSFTSFAPAPPVSGAVLPRLLHWRVGLLPIWYRQRYVAKNFAEIVVFVVSGHQMVLKLI